MICFWAVAFWFYVWFMIYFGDLVVVGLLLFGVWVTWF